MSYPEKFRQAIKAKVQAYVDGVLSGEITAGRYVWLAVARHVDDLENAEARGYVFCEDIAADHCLWITAHCQHSKGEFAGKPFVLSDNQLFIVWTLFGWRCADDGTRRFREAYITCARKWGKSEFCSALACKVTACDEPREPGAVNLAVATKEAQAKDLIFTQSCRMVRRSPELTKLFKVYARSIVTPDEPGAEQRGSSFAPVGSDSDTNDGHDSHVTFMDELHAWLTRHNGLYERMTTAGGSRRQPLIVVVTTAGDTKSYIWKRRDKFCTNVLDAFDQGKHVGDEHFIFIARFDKGDNPFDEKNWPKANPNYPITPKPRYLRGQATKAKSDPVEKNTFLRFHGNIEVSSTEQAIEPATWAKCRGTLTEWDKAVAVGGGIDIGGIDDLGSIGRCAKFPAGEVAGEPIYRYEVNQQSWISSLHGKPLDQDPWQNFVSREELIVDDFETEAMLAEVVRSREAHGIHSWAYDPHNARDFGNRLRVNYGIDAIEMPQNYQHFNEPIREFMKALQEGRLTSDDDDLLAWCAGNLHIKKYGDRWMCDKGVSSDKIDPIVAVIMAFRVAYFDDSDKPATYYEENELEMF